MSDGAIIPGAMKIPSDGNARFRLPIYEGPLDLLLHLIKKAELDPHDVTTSQITEQYLGYVELLGQLNLDIAGEYLVMAATLLPSSHSHCCRMRMAAIRRKLKTCGAIWSSGCSNINAIARRPTNSASGTSSDAMSSWRRASQSHPMMKVLLHTSP